MLAKLYLPIITAGSSSGSSGRVRGGGPRNMKSMQPPMAAIFFMTYFHRAGGGGGHGPLRPPGSATAFLHKEKLETLNFKLDLACTMLVECFE